MARSKRVLKPGDRVNVIRQVATRLSDEYREDVDLILGQFGFPTDPARSASNYNYCLTMLENEPDEALVNLHQYLFSDEQPTGAPPLTTEGSWEPNRFRLFLCHIAAEKLLLADVKGHLAGYAIDGFLAHEDIEPTKEWVPEIESALETCDALAVFLTPNFRRSFWTDQEIGYCVARKLLIVPVRLGLDPYGFISRYQAMSVKGMAPDEIAANLFHVLLAHRLTRDRMTDALVAKLEDSGSFALAKRNVELVESISAWTPPLLRRLEESIERNSQVKSAYGVPERIRRIIERHRA